MLSKLHNIKFIKFSIDIINGIKNKRELNTLDYDFVKEKLSVFLESKEHQQEKKRLMEKIASSKSFRQFRKSREYDFLIKNMRAELRKIYGVFVSKDIGKREKLLLLIDEKKPNKPDIYNKLLSLHKSTHERLAFYDEIYQKIFFIIEQEFGFRREKYAILDLACGMNPISSIYFQNKIKKYYASDISQDDCAFIKKFFIREKINSKIFVIDLTDIKELDKLKKLDVDICFLFKTLDGLEHVKRNISRQLLNSISAKFIIVSFSTMSLGGKKSINPSKRLWFEKLINNFGWRYKKFDIPGELFYVIEKK